LHYYPNTVYSNHRNGRQTETDMTKIFADFATSPLTLIAIAILILTWVV
jgi:hypothetical protein